MILNKKAMAVNQLGKALIAVAVIVLVVGSFFGLGLHKKIDLLIPNFGFGDGDDDGDSLNLFEEIYLDDREGNCKPLEGEYRLNSNNELERIRVNDWFSVEGDVPNQQEVFHSIVEDGLNEAIDNLVLLFRNNEYQITWTTYGFEATLNDGEIYVYEPPSKLQIKTNIGSFQDVSPEKSIFKLFKDLMEEIRTSFQSSLSNVNVNFIEYAPYLEIVPSYNTDPDTLISTLNNPPQIHLKLYAFVDVGSKRYDETYSIDYERKFYLLSEKYSRGNFLFEDWNEIPESKIASDRELELYGIKENLIKECGNG
jgi:hypothetical protein